MCSNLLCDHDDEGQILKTIVLANKLYMYITYLFSLYIYSMDVCVCVRLLCVRASFTRLS